MVRRQWTKKLTICNYKQEYHIRGFLRFFLKVGDSGHVSILLAADMLTSTTNKSLAVLGTWQSYASTVTH